jgi:PAS domain S-box-containing protein
MTTKEAEEYLKQLSSLNLQRENAGSLSVSAVQSHTPFSLEVAVASLAGDFSFIKTLIDNIPNPIFITHPDSTIKFVNPALEKLTGFSRSDLIGLKLPYPWWPPEMIDRYLNDEPAGRKMDLNQMERSFINKRGERFWVKVKIQSLKQGNSASFYLGIWEDLTERKCAAALELRQAEESQRESEQYRVLVDHANEAIVVLQEGRVKFVNRTTLRLFGAESEQDLADRLLTDFVHPDDRARMVENYVKRIKGEPVPERNQYRLITKDGVVHWAEIGSTLVGWNGKPATSNFLTDITERKLAEEAMLESERKYSTLVEKGNDCIVLIEDGLVRFVNTRMLKMTGYEMGESLGKPFESFASPEYRRIVLERHRRRMAGEDISPNFEAAIIAKDGRQIPVEINANLIEYHGKPANLAFMRDITERKRTQEKLKNSNENLRSALESSIDVAAKMVEMRDPYTAGHQKRVAKLCVAIATEMHLPDEQVAYLSLAAKVHDIGKIHVPAEILSKTGRLTNLEFQMMMTHAQGGYDILNGVEFPLPLAQMILQHHERMDGSGYPIALKGDQILLESKIIAVADTVEAMCGHRPYRPSLGMTLAMAEIKQNKGKLFDTRVVEACVEVVENKGFKFET